MKAQIQEGEGIVTATKSAIKNTLKKSAFILMPILILSVIFIFTKWLEINSFGTVVFWGLFLFGIYNSFFAKQFFMLLAEATNNEKLFGVKSKG